MELTLPPALLAAAVALSGGAQPTLPGSDFTLVAAGPATAQTCPPLPAFAPVVRESLRFSAEESAALYPRIYHCAQPRPQYAWTPQADGSALAIRVRQEREVPIRIGKAFLDKTIAHIEAILAGSRAQALYPIDFNHGHFIFPREAFERRYGKAWRENRVEEVLEAVLADEALEVLYHSQEYFNPKTAPREFVGYYGATPSVKATRDFPAAEMPVRNFRQSVFDFEFLAHPNGAFALANGLRFDFTFQTENPADAYLKRIGVSINYPPEIKR